MTVRKHLKQLVRARMAKTGESYTTARRRIIRDDRPTEVDPAARWHFPGSVPATTALRSLLAQAGVRAPHTGEPFSEAMLFGIAGGIGIGVMSFYYEQADFASFFVGGRHRWFDDQGYLTAGLEAFGLRPEVRECSGAGPAARHLNELLAEYGTCVAWVDSALLPHRGVPESEAGGGYHVVTVYKIEDGRALIGDLTDDPVSIPLPDLAKSRERIKKQKNRLLAAAGSSKAPDLPLLVRRGLQACHRELLEPSMKPIRKNLQVGALRTWAERLHGSTDKESWERLFRPGANLWRGLTSIYEYVEHYGTGGGLSRPIFAEFLREAAAADPRLGGLAAQYEELGAAWSDLAEAALPDNVPLMREAKEVIALRAETRAGGGFPEEMRAIWARLEDLRSRASEVFPLSDAEAADLRASLKQRVLAIHQREAAALDALGAVAAG